MMEPEERRRGSSFSRSENVEVRRCGRSASFCFARDNRSKSSSSIEVWRVLVSRRDNVSATLFCIP